MCRPISRMLLVAVVAGASCSVASVANAGQAGQPNALDFIIPLIEGMNQGQQGQQGQNYQQNPQYQPQNPNYQPNNPNYVPQDHDHNQGQFVPERRVVPTGNPTDNLWDLFYNERIARVAAALPQPPGVATPPAVVPGAGTAFPPGTGAGPIPPNTGPSLPSGNIGPLGATPSPPPAG